jgi:hypothetical protein
LVLSFLTSLLVFTFFLEVKRKRVDTVAFSGWFRPVFKDMPQVASATRADYLDPVHEIAVVLLKPDLIARNYIVKAWPAGSGLKFRIRGKKLLLAGSTPIDSVFLIIV